MSTTAKQTADTVYQAGHDTASSFRRRGTSVKDYATEELRGFLTDVENLVDKLSDVGDADVARLRTRVSDTIGDVRRTVGSVSDTVSDAADSVRERARAAVARTDDYVHDSPWTAIGLAAALGVIVGVGAAAAAAARR